jgi:hypothetical protein
VTAERKQKRPWPENWLNSHIKKEDGEHGNETSDSIKCGTCVGQLLAYHLLKKGPS